MRLSTLVPVCLTVVVAGILTSSAPLSAQATATPAPPAATTEIAPLPMLGDEATRLMTHFFSYDKSIPLEARTVERIEKAGTIKEKIVYRGVHGLLVPAFLQYPVAAKQPMPCVLLLHGWSGQKEVWWLDGGYLSGGEVRKALLEAGYAIFAPDAQIHGDRISMNEYAVVNHYIDPAQGANARRGFFTKEEIYVHSVRDFRRGIDYLQTRKELDPNRIGAVGYSMGGAHTVALMGVEPRVKVGVACVVPAEPTQYSAISPQNFAKGIGDRPLRTIMGRTDPLCPLEKAIGLQKCMNPKTCDQILIDAGHKLPVTWVPFGIEWIKKHL